MQLKKTIALFLLLPLVAFAKPTITNELEIVSELPLEKQVEFYTSVYGGNSDLNKRVIDCESQWNTKALGDGGRSYGIGQFQKPSFDNLSRLMGEELNYYSPHDQIKLLVWSIANGYGNQWTAYRAIKNGGKYSFYSNQLKKHFTVVCK